MSFYWLFGTFYVFAASALYPSSFEPSSFSSSLTGRSQRTRVSAGAQGHFLRPNPNWKRLMLMKDEWCAAQSDSHNACNISSAPLSSDGLERRISGKAPRPRGGFTRKHDRRGPNGHSLASWTDKDCHAPCAITLSPHRRCPLWKKVWSPACPLNSSFQLPNCPLKGFLHSPNGIF